MVTMMLSTPNAWPQPTGSVAVRPRTAPVVRASRPAVPVLATSAQSALIGYAAACCRPSAMPTASKATTAMKANWAFTGHRPRRLEEHPT